MIKKIKTVFNDDKAPDLLDALILLSAGLLSGMIGGIIVSTQMLLGVL